MQIDGFQWDDGNHDKCQKHGASIKEIEALFSSGDLIVLPDPFEHEERLRGVGRSAGGRSYLWSGRCVRLPMAG